MAPHGPRDGGRVDTLQAGLARRVDLGENQCVRLPQRLTETVQQTRRPGIPVRLEHHDQAARSAEPGRLQHRPNLRRVVSVVVHDFDAAGKAVAGIATRRTGEAAQGAGRGIRSDPQPRRRSDGRQRVEQIVATRNRKRQLHRGAPVPDARDHPRGGPGRPELDAIRAHAGGRDLDPAGHDGTRTVRRHPSGLGIIHARHQATALRHAGRERPDRANERVESLVRLQVLVVHVRHHRNLGGQMQKRPVALVGLDDHERPAPPPGVAPQGVDHSADDNRRIQPGRVENQSQHGRRGGLAVGPGHGDRPFPLRELRQHRAAPDDGNAPALRVDELRVVRRYRRRDHDDIRRPDVGCRMSFRDPNPDRTQSSRGPRRLEVGPAHLVARAVQQLRDAAHPDATDAHHVDPSDSFEHTVPISPRRRPARRIP